MIRGSRSSCLSTLEWLWYVVLDQVAQVRWSGCGSDFVCRYSHFVCDSLPHKEQMRRSEQWTGLASMQPPLLQTTMARLLWMHCTVPSSSSVKVTNHSFLYASPCLWNQPPALFRQPHPNHSPSHSSHLTHLGASVPIITTFSIHHSHSIHHSKLTFSTNPSHHISSPTALYCLHGLF